MDDEAVAGLAVVVMGNSELLPLLPGGVSLGPDVLSSSDGGSVVEEPSVFTLFSLIRYVEVLLWAWNTLVAMAKYQNTANKTAILRHTNATAKVTFWRNRDVIFARNSSAASLVHK